MTQDQANPKVNPFAGLLSIISRHGLGADAVICCGDLGDKAHPDAQQYAWAELHKLKATLRASALLATAGNHDLDSRYAYNTFDARGQLQSLVPRFPVDDEVRWLEYWAKNFTTVEICNTRFLLLNTAAYHGGGKEQHEELEKGRVSERTIDRIIKDLEAQGERSANILICHHHPYKNDQIKLNDYSEMRDGDVLLNRLSKANMGPWLVIHGHKHLPRIFQAPGGNMMPTVFSAGSFAARLFPEYQSVARNEFYMLQLKVPDEHSTVTSLRGKIDAWQWAFGEGWVRPKNGVGLGPHAAFGARVDLGILASTLANTLGKNHSGAAVPWEDVVAIDENVDHLMPDDLDSLLRLLREKHNLRALRDDETGRLVEVQVP